MAGWDSHPLEIADFHGILVSRDFRAVHHTQVDQVILAAGSGNDKFFIEETLHGSDMTILGNDGNDEFNVGTISGPSTVDGILSQLSVQGGNGLNTALLDDAADGTADKVTITETTVDAGGSGFTADSYFNYAGSGGSFEYHDLDALTVITGGGNDTVNVEGIATTTTINANDGEDTITVAGMPDPDFGEGGGEGSLRLIKDILYVNGDDA